jgi:indolepyruvate decarboxylase
MERKMADAAVPDKTKEVPVPENPRPGRNPSLADYVIARLADLGIEHAFGVPGDGAFHIDDAIERSNRVTWVKCSNELNAAYAADGYARVRGAAILTTTYVVGEASALNGVLGSKAERLPVFHLVGWPSARLRRTRRQLHHTFGDGEIEQFRVPSELAACVSAALTPENAVRELERVIDTALHERRPAYITIPYDYGRMPVIGKPVKGSPLADVTSAHSDQVELEGAMKAILAALGAARRPVILAAFTLARYGVTREAEALVKASGIPFATTSMDKGVLPESHPLYAGQYAGEGSTGDARRLVEEADLVLDLGGVILHDTGTALSARLNAAKIMTIGPSHVALGAEIDFGGPGPKTFGPVAMKDVLTRLTRELPRFEKHDFKRPSGFDTKIAAEDPISYQSLCGVLQAFLASGDILVSGCGNAMFMLPRLLLPEGVQYFGQYLWASIGWGTPAAFGAAIAAPDRKVILVEGDGSHQISANEVGTVARHTVAPIMLILANEIYGVEEYLLGNDDVDRVRGYDRLPPWRYSEIPSAMGCSGWFTPVVRTNGELQAALQRARDETLPSYIEVRLEPSMIAPMSGRDFQRVYQTSEPSSEIWRPVAVALNSRRPTRNPQ